ncbi:MAG: pilus assembly protein [Mesorhizobium sp.]|nr:MAG: pilus assembly protein [Mesorhizobium sp.]TIP10839.1 MAG: pilus assembly protein [Mesorhizobium sp.]
MHTGRRQHRAVVRQRKRQPGLHEPRDARDPGDAVRSACRVIFVERRPVRVFRSDSGVAAVEFALVVPIVCLALLGVINGWSFVSSSLSMRAGVKTAANLVMQGSVNDAAIQAVALSSWENRPDAAQVTLGRKYMCGSTVVDASTLCGGVKAPSVFVEIQATATWSPPFSFGVFSFSRELSHQQVIRVR